MSEALSSHAAKQLVICDYKIHPSGSFREISSMK